jgi:metal-dependent amidase/aminoacylase/carboxypeptidase family protein
VPIRPQAAALLAGQLRGFGYNVTEHVGKYPKPEWQGHGIVALMKNGAGPTVLVRADMDALPVEEQTGLPYVKDQWHGTLVLIGQPSEETIDGARAMLADGLYSRIPRPDYALALHDSSELEAGKISYTLGYSLASSTAPESKL